MKKSRLITLLGQVKAQANSEVTNKSPDYDRLLIAMQVVELLVGYTNDPQIREAVDEIPF